MPAVSEAALRSGPVGESGPLPVRPWAVTLLGLALASTPALQALSVVGPRVLNASPERPWSWVAYGILGPYVSWLLWRGRPRARFAAYLFMTHEVVRGLVRSRPSAVVAALAAIGILQLPSVRRYLPAIRPSQFGRFRRNSAGS